MLLCITEGALLLLLPIMPPPTCTHPSPSPPNPCLWWLPFTFVCAVCAGVPPAALLNGVGTWTASCNGTTLVTGLCYANCAGGYGSASIRCGSSGWLVTSFTGGCSKTPGKTGGARGRRRGERRGGGWHQKGGQYGGNIGRGGQTPKRRMGVGRGDRQGLVGDESHKVVMGYAMLL